MELRLNPFLKITFIIIQTEQLSVWQENYGIIPVISRQAQKAASRMKGVATDPSSESKSTVKSNPDLYISDYSTKVQ
jgi:hypothetical protein